MRARVATVVRRVAPWSPAVYRRALKLMDRALERIGVVDSEDEIIVAANAVWNAPAEALSKGNIHFRGAGPFSNDALWLEIGREHLELYKSFARAVGFDRPLRSVVDWGCGGGLNAFQFGPLADEYVGVDVAVATLDECERQAKTAGTPKFRPILIEIAQPEAAIDQISTQCDLFLCTYVFEVFPTRDYGLRILRIAEQLLAPGGMAFVQIKYATGSRRTASYRRGYRRNLSQMAAYFIDEFWLSAQDCGLMPKLVTLVPQHVLDPRYAYFLLMKPTDAEHTRAVSKNGP